MYKWMLNALINKYIAYHLINDLMKDVKALTILQTEFAK